MVAWEVLLIWAMALMIQWGSHKRIRAAGSGLGAGWSGMAQQRRLSSAPCALILHQASPGLFSWCWYSSRSRSTGGQDLLKISPPHIRS